MVGKSRNTLRGTARSTHGNAGGGGSVDSERLEDTLHRQALETGNIIEDALSAQPEGTIHNGQESLAEIINTTPIGDVVPDLSGRGTPGERIAPRKLGMPGIGAGVEGNLGVHHGRSPSGGDIPGGGGVSKTTAKLLGKKSSKTP